MIDDPEPLQHLEYSDYYAIFQDEKVKAKLSGKMETSESKMQVPKYLVSNLKLHI